MGYYWVIGFWVGLGFGSETPTENGFCRSLLGYDTGSFRWPIVSFCLTIRYMGRYIHGYPSDRF